MRIAASGPLQVCWSSGVMVAAGEMGEKAFSEGSAPFHREDVRTVNKYRYDLPSPPQLMIRQHHIKDGTDGTSEVTTWFERTWIGCNGHHVALKSYRRYGKFP